MPLEPHATMGMSSPSSVAVLVVLFLVSIIYLRWSRRSHVGRVSAIPFWRVACFIIGMFLIWIALGSPLAAYDHALLTVHMIQHLLLMTFAPALILLGEPLFVFWHGLSQRQKIVLAPLVRLPFAQRLARILSHPIMCLSVSSLTLLGWHVPALFTLGMRSEFWHSLEQASFLLAGLLFWLPVIRPWPDGSTEPNWSTLLYLFLATLPCDILSGFLVFSDRVAYPFYLAMPRHFGFSVLDDQQCAAALMWACVTLVYLVPAAILTSRLLSPRSSYRIDSMRPELGADIAAERNPGSLGTV